MIGAVAAEQALLRLTIIGPGDGTYDVEAVIDTGFNGALALPHEIIRTLRLPGAGSHRATLGNGTTVLFNLYLGAVIWDGRQREVLVLQGGATPLLGMSLLRGHRVVLDVVDGGEVHINPWP